MNYVVRLPVTPLVELTQFACHFPLGDPQEEGFGYCGAIKKIGSPYCDRHHRIAYVAPERTLFVGPGEEVR